MLPSNKQLLQEMKQTNYGRALQELLDEKYEELSNVKNCKSWDDTLGRQHAVRILDDIFSFMRDKVDAPTKTRYD